MSENKMITHYHITTYESGIVELLITTQDRWLDYHRYSDDFFEVSDYERNSEKLEVKLPLEDKMRYSISSLQEKDQIIYYYIPLYLIMEKDKWDKIKENDTRTNFRQIHNSY